jgi:hypothetical protein
MLPQSLCSGESVHWQMRFQPSAIELYHTPLSEVFARAVYERDFI